ncbi:voltage-dependent potassium channel, beta subunit [Mycotypha africana]|uniref:voltage-dependent potassium channel, beta subunit n=1 Tax=Mycotypha africana TaxID=64632 RepID=UPI002301F54B|nr:voltage-dependent potassium channel, beta subunit [Mycotypha africana]KAI8979082.1 voltage-dependent potassium channel, beta subunit [Mycotypha africana]
MLNTESMEYRYVGHSGLKVSILSLGSWITFGGQISPEQTTEIVKTALEKGINHFDVAESHAGGQAEVDLGLALRSQKGLRRSDFVVSTKVFWGGKGPNDRGLSRKHVFEGTVACLQRLQLDYVDILYAQRPDPDTPMEEVVRAFNWCIDKGMALYWGTSEWPAYLITEAMNVAERLHLIAPITESPQYNMLNRERVEKEYCPLFKQYKLGICTWSPLASGLLTGKYNDGTIPPYTRFAIQDHPVINRLRCGLFSEEGRRKLEKIKRVCQIAKTLHVTPAQLGIAWCLKNPNVTSVIIGASTPAQAKENIQALNVRHLLTDDVMLELDTLLANKPDPVFDFRKS